MDMMMSSYIPHTTLIIGIIIWCWLISIIQCNVDVVSYQYIIKNHDMNDIFPNEWNTNHINNTHHNEIPSCRLYLAPKMNFDGEKVFTLYSGMKHTVAEQPLLGTSINELVIIIHNAMTNDISPFHSYQWGSSFFNMNMNNNNDTIYISGGIGTIIQCSNADEYTTPNIITSIEQQKQQYNTDSNNKEDDETTITINNTFIVSSIRNIDIGEELILNCHQQLQGGGEDQEEGTDNDDNNNGIVSIKYLEKNGICFDADRWYEVKPSTIPNAGNGLFSKKVFNKNEMISISPVILFDRSQLNIVQQYTPNDIEYDPSLPNFRSTEQQQRNIQYKASKVLGQFSILNYCYGNIDSNVLLLPYGPGIQYINHGVQPNVYIQWSDHPIFHNNEYNNEEGYDNDYFFNHIPLVELYEHLNNHIYFGFEYKALRTIEPGEELFIDYGIHWLHAYNNYTSNNINKNNIEQQPFRHEIHVSDDFLPNHWMKYKKQQKDHQENNGKSIDNDFIANTLKSGYIAPIRWHDTHEVVTSWIFRIGLPSTLREVLLEYCNKVGITKLLRHVTIDGNTLIPGDEQYITFDNINHNKTVEEQEQWYIQRPTSEWQSNMHWLSPAEENAQQSYLQALSYAGFDDVLQSIGEYFNFNGLVVHHVTFIAVSYSTKGYIHCDMRNTGGRVYNIIVPLILVNETDPELELLEGLSPDTDEESNTHYETSRRGRYQYEYDVGVMIGDNTDHGTAAVDYRTDKQMRLAATIYIADINIHNVNNVAYHSTQAYPDNDPEMLLKWAGKHWSKTDSTKKLPKPNKDHILFQQQET